MGQIDFNKLWANFMDTVQNHYSDFTGRVGMAQFWWFVAVCIGVQLVASIVDAAFTGGLLRGLVALALAMPTGGMAARRMQDTGRDGQLAWIWVIVYIVCAFFWLLIGLSPFGIFFFVAIYFSFGWLVQLALAVISLAIIYFCIQPGQPETNAYGPPPPVWTPSA